MFDRLKAIKAALASKKAKELIGEGAFGKVYADTPGVVVKQITEETPDKLLNEINLQAKAAELNIAPKLKEAQVNSPRVATGGGTISMQDLRDNYVQLGQAKEEVLSGQKGVIGMNENYYTYYDPSLNSKQVTLRAALSQTITKIFRSRLDTN